MIDPDELADRARRLGLHPEDVAELVPAYAGLTDADRAEIDAWSARLVTGIGRFQADRSAIWDGAPGGSGLLAVLALIDSASAVAAYHADRGVPPEISAATLADLGEQICVHRQTFGSFGLHTQGWMTTVWSGALYGLGRLQFELLPDPGGRPDRWVASTHIPEAGRLTPDVVDDAFARARTFFPEHFPEFALDGFFCRSWLLDPRLPDRLPGSNLASFQQRWQLAGPPQPGDIDTLFFVFHRRGPVEIDELPTATSLQRATVELLRAGDSWQVREGRIPW